MVQWLGFSTFTVRGLGSIPGWGTKILQASQPKIIYVAWQHHNQSLKIKMTSWTTDNFVMSFFFFNRNTSIKKKKNWEKIISNIYHKYRASCNAGDTGDSRSIPGLGRSPGEGNGNPLILAGEIPWIEESRGLQSVESQRVGHNWALTIIITSTGSLISHASKVTLKILQARLQQYVNRELDIQVVQDGFRKGRGTRDKIVNIHWITEKAREFQKNICFIDYAKAFDCVDHNTLWKTLKEMVIPDHLTCLLRNLYAGQEAS